MRVTIDARDEGRTEAVDGERPGDLERLAGGDVRVDFGVRDVGSEGDGRRRDGAFRTADGAATVVDQPVAGMEVSGSSALQHPSFPRHRGQVRLAVDDAVELEGGVPTEHETVDVG
ncbi:MAG: hypothetical protein JWN80_1171 [Microbacteriaceae bacterium]|nr:hypothetical protein [Microbacteriaceae bacterium]